MPKISSTTDNVKRIVKIEIIYDPEYKNQTIRISTANGSVRIPIKIDDMPENILSRIKDILDIEKTEIISKEVVKEVPVTKDIPYDWTKIIQPYNPTYPSPVTVPYKNPEILYDVNKGQSCVECSDKTTV